MNYYAFKNYEEFKELFGMKELPNGNMDRRNKILLSYLKSKELYRYARENHLEALLQVRDMTTLYNTCVAFIGLKNDTGIYCVDVMGTTYMSDMYKSDGEKGICVDRDFNKYRYINVENGRVFKMKMGKLFKHLISMSSFGRALPEPVVLWLCEEITQKWQTYCRNKIPDYTLHMERSYEAFKKIYDYFGDCRGSFGSCMTGGRHASFYMDALDASAAWLEDGDGKIIARCVVYNHVEDGDGKVWRLAERQYSTDGDEVLKRCLVASLIEGGYIDGYKKVGADCHNARGFVANNDTSLSDKEFCIRCDLNSGDVLSYQDSFKWYDHDSHTSYNYESGNYTDMLDSTDDYFDYDEEENYDEYHDEYTTSDVVNVLYQGRQITCSENRLDDFNWVDSIDMYVHEDDCAYCHDVERYERTDDCYWCEETEEWFYYEDSRDEARDEYRKKYMTYTEWDDDWHDNSDIEYYFAWNGSEYVETPISSYNLSYARLHGLLFDHEGEAYDTLEHIKAA